MAKTVTEKVKRSIRTKIRCTDDEMLALHRIADEQHTTIANILRESTLERPYERLIANEGKDLQELASLVNSFDGLADELVFMVRSAGHHLASNANEAEHLWKEIDKVYTSVVQTVSEKRKRVSRSVITIIKDETTDAIYDYEDDYKRRAYGLSISVTEEEIKEIRRLADMEGCSISCLLKTNAFEFYKYGRIEIECDNIDKVKRRLNHELRFLPAIILDTLNRGVNEADALNIIAVFNRVLTEFKQFEAGIKSEPTDVREEAKRIVKKHEG